MMTIQLSTHTYELLARRARQIRRSPDALADEVLHRELQPVHPYVETQTSLRGERAVVKNVGTPISVIVGYAQLGLAPEDFAEEVHAALAPAMVYDALSYYHDHRTEIDREIADNTEETLRLRLAERMRSPEDNRRVTGRSG
jgi:uncharacterized protein (DUF433 family)